MIKIAVCDDEQYCINSITDLLNEYKTEKKLELEIDTYLLSSNLLKSNLKKYDLIFLDVEMGGENGIEVARKIRLHNKEVFLVYVSGLISYAPAGYEVRARAYLLKNDLITALKSTMDGILKEITFREYTYKMKIDDNEIEIPLKNILFVESFNKTIMIHTIDYIKPNYEIRIKLKDFFDENKDKGFLQIHKSYLVNMENVLKMRNYKAYLKNNVELNVSQRKWAEVHSKYIDWRGRM